MSKLSIEEREELQKKRTECQIFSRVCGWLVPRHAMNLGKQAERKDLKPYDYDVSMNNEITSCN